MSDKSDIRSGIEAARNPICRVAYTIDNYQPVISTIIGDQPLFYMDFDVHEEEEMDMADFGILENELATLKKQITGRDGFIDGYDAFDTQKRIDQFVQDGSFITATQEKTTTQDNDERIDVLVKKLSQSRLVNEFLLFAKEHCVEIVLNAQVKDSFYDRKSGLINLNPHLDDTLLALLAIRELRAHWNHRQGVLIHPLLFQPDNAILVHRVQQADYAVMIVRAAWELQLSGYKEPWEYLEESSMGDLCRSFARESHLDFRNINNGFSCASVFETWFLSDRVRYQDKNIIQAMLSDHNGYVFEFVEALQNITAELIGKIGALPFGKNYLAEHSYTIMNDPIFTDVRDRSNANFLWFIKFERSFKEAEQELQNVFEPAAQGVPPGAKNPSIQDQKHEEYETSKIVKLYDAQTQDAGQQGQGLRNVKRANARAGEKGADVIYLTNWSDGQLK